MSLSRTARLAGLGAYFVVACGVPLVLMIRWAASRPPGPPDGYLIAGLLWLAFVVSPHLVAVGAMLPGRDRVRGRTYIGVEAACGVATLVVAALGVPAHAAIARLTGSHVAEFIVAVLLVPLGIVLATRAVWARWMPRRGEHAHPTHA